MALQSRGVNVKQYCPLLVVTFPFLLKNFFLNSSGLNSCSWLPDSRNDYKNMKTAVLHVSDVYVSVIGLYSRQGNYVIFAVYPALHILPAQKYKYKYRCQGNCVKCIKAGHFCKQYIAQASIKELPIDFHPFSSTITHCHYFHISKTHYQEIR